MGKAVSVHPLAVILAVTGGGFLFGIVGALFAVPLVAVLNSVVSYIVRTNAGDGDSEDAEEDPPRDPDEREATAVLESAKERLNDAVHESAEDERASGSGATDSGESGTSAGPERSKEDPEG